MQTNTNEKRAKKMCIQSHTIRTNEKETHLVCWGVRRGRGYSIRLVCAGKRWWKNWDHATIIIITVVIMKIHLLITSLPFRFGQMNGKWAGKKSMRNSYLSCTHTHIYTPTTRMNVEQTIVLHIDYKTEFSAGEKVRLFLFPDKKRERERKRIGQTTTKKYVHSFHPVSGF